MSLVLEMLRTNTPLRLWRTHAATSGGYGGSKNPEKLARAIFSQLSHEETVVLIAQEFEALPAQVRLELSTLCNSGNATGNVRKNVQRLNVLLQGKLLREVQDQTYRVMGRDGWESRKVNQAVAGAQRKYAAR